MRDLLRALQGKSLPEPKPRPFRPRHEEFWRSLDSVKTDGQELFVETRGISDRELHAEREMFKKIAKANYETCKNAAKERNAPYEEQYPGTFSQHFITRKWNGKLRIVPRPKHFSRLMHWLWIGYLLEKEE